MIIAIEIEHIAKSKTAHDEKEGHLISGSAKYGILQ